jgi:hypothetical protein
MTRNPVAAVLMVIAGVIFLLPGVCAIVFMAAGGTASADSSIAALWLICFVIAGLGVLLIVGAFR